MSTEIIYYSDAKLEIKSGIDYVANAVKITLGPKGRNVIIGNNRTSPHITKDGVSVAKSIKLKDNFQNIGAQLIQEVASKTCNDVGDGTTTATILAQTIINYGSKLLEKGINPILLKKEIDKLTPLVVDFIKSKSIQISNDISNIKNIATISANNDEELGSLIADAFEKITTDGVIIVEESKNVETKVDIIKGMQVNRGYLAPHFVTDMIKNEAVLEDVYVFISDKKIHSMRDIVKILEHVAQSGKSLLIMAEDFDNEVIENLKLNKIQNILKVVAIKSPSFGEYRKDILGDIAILTKGKYISYDSGIGIKDVTIDMLGYCDKVIVTKDTTTIINGYSNTNDINNRVLQIKEQLKTIDNEFLVSQMKERIAKLVGGIAVLSIGGTTETEMKERKDRVDDAIAATRAAIEEGVVVGGGVTYLNAVSILDNIEITSDIQQQCIALIKLALIKPFHQILENIGYNDAQINDIQNKILENNDKNYGYDANNETFCDLYKKGIVDPTKVSRLAFENAMSIASLFLTTDCIIAEENEVMY